MKTGSMETLPAWLTEKLKKKIHTPIHVSCLFEVYISWIGKVSACRFQWGGWGLEFRCFFLRTHWNTTIRSPFSTTETKTLYGFNTAEKTPPYCRPSLWFWIACPRFNIVSTELAVHVMFYKCVGQHFQNNSIHCACYMSVQVVELILCLEGRRS